MADGTQAGATSETASEPEPRAKPKKAKSWPKTLANGEKEKPEKKKKPDDGAFAGHVLGLRIGSGNEAPVTLDIKAKKGERGSFALDSSDAIRLQAMVSVIAAAQSTGQKLRLRLSKNEQGARVVKELELRSKR